MKTSSAIPRLLVGLLGGGLLFTPQLASAETFELEGDRIRGEQRIAQQVVEGLPPPPPVIFGQGAANQPTSGASQYWVVVNGDSSLLLSQVQAVVGEATVQEYNGQRFIQVGVYNDAATAQQMVSALATQGISAETLAVNAGASTATTGQVAQQPLVPALPPPDSFPVTPVPRASAPREVEFGQPSNLSQPGSALPPPQTQSAATGNNSRHYYVVIPGSADNVAAITNQVARLGEGFDVGQMVQASESRRGSYVRVGPFADRSAANRWNRYFRDFGMDARVYFSR